MAKNHGSSIKDDETYEALRRQGAGKEKAARIANASNASQKGGNAPPYEEWTKSKLYDRAKELSVEGRSKMSKAELIEALRNR